jgi:hypothetical protein
MDDMGMSAVWRAPAFRASDPVGEQPTETGASQSLPAASIAGRERRDAVRLFAAGRERSMSNSIAGSQSVIGLTLRSFGVEPPPNMGAARHAMLWLASLVFVVLSVAILAVFNLFSVLLFGVAVSFLGRNGVRFHFLHFFRRVPVIAVTTPVLFCYAAWTVMRADGVLATIGPALLTAVLAVLMLAGAIALNTMSRPADDEAGRSEP